MSSFNRWSKFITNKGKSAIPANSMHVALYLTYLLNIGCSFHVISSAVYAIKWAHSILGYEDPTEHPFIKNIVEASKRNNKARVIKKEVVTTKDLVLLCDIYADSSSLLEVRDMCMILLSFAGFLRYEELSSLRCSDVKFLDGYVKIFINKSKTDQYRQGNEILISAGVTSACPVKMLQRYISLGNIDIFSDHFLFKSVFKSKEGLKLIYKNKKLSYTRARECMLSKLKSVMGNVNIGLHSLRSGGATAAANSNVNERCWKKHGKMGIRFVLRRLCKRQCRKHQRSGDRVLSKVCQHKKRDADLGGKAGGSYNITRYNPGFCFNCKRNRFCQDW